MDIKIYFSTALEILEFLLLISNNFDAKFNALYESFGRLCYALNATEFNKRNPKEFTFTLN